MAAPTGSGKTEAALFWGLNKAKQVKARRLILVLPFKALIEDQYERLVKYFGKNNVSMWDSDAFTKIALEMLKELEDSAKSDNNRKMSEEEKREDRGNYSSLQVFYEDPYHNNHC